MDNVPFLKDVIAGVESRLGDSQFGAADLAAEGALSQRQLTRLKEEIGETPAALICRLRLERAAPLLGEEGLTVSETAYAVGYDSPSHVARTFRRRFNCTPSECRNA